MRRVLVIVVLMVWAAGLLGQAGGVIAPADKGGGLRFVPVDVVIDSGKTALGAYQFEVKALEGVKVAGLEGGEPGVFHEAPYYDPAALTADRLVVAAFSTADKLPAGNVRVARLHLMVGPGIDDAALLKMGTKLIVATDGEGRTIAANVSLKLMQGDK